ncbi:GAK5 protein, partial [Notiomystis cincta]|nr:GAK5 protein [Notiomystis cincta]
TDTQEAADAVSKFLAYENANHDGEKGLDLIKNGANVDLTDYIKACTSISSEQFKAKLITAVVAEQLQVARAAIKCFECREQGHIRKQCPKGQKGNKKPKKTCPHCQKGFHWSNQRWSKYDKDSNSLPKQGNSKWGVGCGAVTPSPTGPHSIRHQHKHKPC